MMHSALRTPHSELSVPTEVSVVYIIDDLGLGGAQRQLAELVKALPKAQYRAHVISLSTKKLTYVQAIRKAGVSVELIPQAGKWSWASFVRLYRRLRRLQPTIVHTWLFTADLYGRLAAWLLRTPVIISAVRSIDPWKPWHYVVADRLLCRVTDAFTVNARAITGVLTRRERIDPEKIHTVYNGVDVSLFDPAKRDGELRQRWHVAREAPLIGTIGRLGPEKDHATFLRAAALVLRHLPQARFLIVGDGALERSLRHLTRVLDVEEQVRFLESQSRIEDIFAALDLVVVSSRYEGCCNVILEAMAMGKPVVATAVGGNPELVVSGETGLLVPPEDPDRLANAMVQVLRAPARAQAMGRAGRNRVETRFSVPRMVEQTAALYRSLLGGVAS